MKDDGSICTSTDPCSCDSNGACACGVGYIGNKCDECKSGYFDLDGNESNSITSCIGKSFKNSHQYTAVFPTRCH